MYSATHAAVWDYLEVGHKVTFDPFNRYIIVADSVTDLDIQIDIYSDSKEWMLLRNNRWMKPPVRATGRDVIPSGFTGATYFLTNGWKLLYDPTKVKVNGVLFSDDYDTAYYTMDAIPVYPATVSALVSTSIVTQNVVTGDVSSIVVPTASQNAQAVQTQLAGDFAGIPQSVWAAAVEGLTAEEMLRVMLAALAGKRSGIGTTTEQYFARDGVTPRITFTPTDVSGNGAPVINGAP